MSEMIMAIRLKLINWIFPSSGWGRCANRSWSQCRFKNFTITLEYTNKEERDDYNYEEFYTFFSIFIHRFATDDEWKNMIALRNAEILKNEN